MIFVPTKFVTNLQKKTTDQQTNLVFWDTLIGVLEDTGFGGKRGETIGGSQNVPQCELRSFLVIGEVEKINDVLYKLLQLVRSFLVIGEEEKIICTVWYPLD